MGLEKLFLVFDERRRQLGMSCACLAKRAGLSTATVVRILSGGHLAAGIDKVHAISVALDMDGLKPAQNPRPHVSRKKQAQRKADDLVGMLQATTGLEGQSLNPVDVQEMKEQTVHELLAGSKKRLWG